ncbi:hypothetical protein G6F56_013371 [Rhizopus delemar]|nr:hypothetical protein G6F56_013371 [Rhizopus delemar]
MKVEPLHLNLPRRNKRNSVLQLSVKTSSSSSGSHRPNLSNKSAQHSPSSSSSQERPQKTRSSRKLKGQSHLGITRTTQPITPPLKSAPIQPTGVHTFQYFYRPYRNQE